MTTSHVHWCGRPGDATWNNWTERKDCSDILHRPRGGSSDTGLTFRLLDPALVWTCHIGTRFSAPYKKTSISARTARRRSHATERLPARGSCTGRTMARTMEEDNELPQISACSTSGRQP